MQIPCTGLALKLHGMAQAAPMLVRRLRPPGPCPSPPLRLHGTGLPLRTALHLSAMATACCTRSPGEPWSTTAPDRPAGRGRRIYGFGGSKVAQGSGPQAHKRNRSPGGLCSGTAAYTNVQLQCKAQTWHVVPQTTAASARATTISDIGNWEDSQPVPGCHVTSPSGPTGQPSPSSTGSPHPLDGTSGSSHRSHSRPSGW